MKGHHLGSRMVPLHVADYRIWENHLKKESSSFSQFHGMLRIRMPREVCVRPLVFCSYSNCSKKLLTETITKKCLFLMQLYETILAVLKVKKYDAQYTDN